MIEHSVTGASNFSKSFSRSNQALLIRTLLAVIVLFAIFSVGCKSSNGQERSGGAKGAGKSGGAGGATPVVGIKVEKGDIGVVLTGLGTVTPLNTVTVKSRVDGQLDKVLYKEGQNVHRGDLLAEIDPRPFQVQLVQAEGQLAKDQAALNNARLDLKRFEDLLPHNAIPEQQVATQRALVEQDEGAVKSDAGPIEAAKLNLAYSKITAPFSGRVGLRLVDPGNIVHAADSNGLLVITQVQPISVVFTIAEDQAPAVLRKMAGGKKLTVTAYDRDQKKKLADGTLTSVDNQIDPTTGTLKLRATFENSKFELFPSQFVNINLLLEQKQNVTLINSAAIQRNTDNTYVYLVKPDSTVTVRNIGLGTQQNNQTEVTSGLNPGDVVVMTGVDKLQEGSKVSVHFAGAAQGTKEAE
jgi:multidrug efflux system membrane fusion protein